MGSKGTEKLRVTLLLTKVSLVNVTPKSVQAFWKGDDRLIGNDRIGKGIITMVIVSPLSGVASLPNCLFTAYKWGITNYWLTGMILQVVDKEKDTKKSTWLARVCWISNFVSRHIFLLILTDFVWWNMVQQQRNFDRDNKVIQDVYVLLTSLSVCG